MKKLFNSKGLYIYVGIVCLFVIAFSFILTYESYDDTAISVKFVDGDNNISVSNVLPMTDRIGKLIGTESNDAGITGYVEFEVKSLVDGEVDYEVYLVQNDAGNEVPVKFVKIYLTNEKDMGLTGFEKCNLPTFYELNVSDIDPNGKVIYNGTLKSNERKKFRLRMWVADTYELTAKEKKFSANVYIRVK